MNEDERSLATLVGLLRRAWAVSKFRVSAGLLMYRLTGGALHILLVHPGGPYFLKKDEGDCDPGATTCNTFTIEWPPRSGRHEAFPEIDRAALFVVEEARRKINAGQVPLIDELDRIVRGGA